MGFVQRGELAILILGRIEGRWRWRWRWVLKQSVDDVEERDGED